MTLLLLKLALINMIKLECKSQSQNLIRERHVPLIFLITFMCFDFDAIETSAHEQELIVLEGEKGETELNS